MKYRYVEFTDRAAAGPKTRKNGTLCCAGKPSEELIAELELSIVHLQNGYTLYQTTLQALGEKGWELQFVTPCGVNLDNARSIGGPIENSYIFRKTGQ